MPGCMARACANARPGVETEPLGRIIDGGEDFSIAALAGDDQRRDRIASRDLAMRSVESRRSHRLSMRCEDETPIAVTPFKNP